MNAMKDVPTIQAKCPCGGGCPRCGGMIQAKLTIGRSNDKYEQEADRGADKVMRMPEPTVQRQAEEEEEERVQAVSEGQVTQEITPLVRRQPLEEEKEDLQAKANGSEEWGPPAIPRGGAMLKGAGARLPRADRDFFEPRFGRDFSGVRVHAGALAGELARQVNARAFTVGSNVVFGHGQYAPGAAEARKLLAHELVHVVQQNAPTETNCARVASRVQRIPLPAHIEWLGVPAHLRAFNPADRSLIDNELLPDIREAVRLRHDFQRLAPGVGQPAGQSPRRRLTRPPLWESRFMRGPRPVRGMVTPPLPRPTPSIQALVGRYEALRMDSMLKASRVNNTDLMAFLAVRMSRLFPDIGFQFSSPPRALARLNPGRSVLDQIRELGPGAPDLVRLLMTPRRRLDEFYW